MPHDARLQRHIAKSMGLFNRGFAYGTPRSHRIRRWKALPDLCGSTIISCRRPWIQGKMSEPRHTWAMYLCDSYTTSS